MALQASDTEVTLRVGYLITSPWPSPGRRGTLAEIFASQQETQR